MPYGSTNVLYQMTSVRQLRIFLQLSFWPPPTRLGTKEIAGFWFVSRKRPEVCRYFLLCEQVRWMHHDLIHPSAWKVNSANFVLKLSEKGFEQASERVFG